MLELSDMNFKGIKMLQQAVTNIFETNENIERFSKEIETIIKEIENIKKNQMEIL